MDFINILIGTPLGYIMRLCYILVENYGLAIILFAVVTKIIMFPLNIWVQKNSIKMIKLQPKLNMIAVENAGNSSVISEKQFALYKQENYKPLASVIPMLIQIPLILGLIAVIYNPLQHLLHIDTNVIDAFVKQATEISGQDQLGSLAHLKVIELLKNPENFQQFASINVAGASEAAVQIQSLSLNFLGLNLSKTPAITVINTLLFIPLFSGISVLVLSIIQNRVNVLQREANWLGRWGMAIFLIAFSLFFTFIVPAGVGVYWICSNLLTIVALFVVNAMYSPKLHIDYDELEKSKIALAKSKELAKKNKPTSEQKASAKKFYKHFIDESNTKKLVFYSEKNGYYKYFKGVIEYILENSDLVIHYVTSDPNDDILKSENKRIVPYYINDSHLMILFMKIDADMVVMTMPDLQQYQLKRSLVRKDCEYVYMFHYPLSTTMVLKKDALTAYDTIFCVGEFQFDEIRQTEEHYGLKKKHLVEFGYSVLEDMSAQYEKIKENERDSKKILIAPSWQEDNILDSCIHELLSQLLGKGHNVVVRPHPEYVKRYPHKMNSIVEKYADYNGDDLTFELDFTDSSSLFNSDIVISDWSGAAYEFAFVTLKPVVFINTEPKINNKEYDVIEAKPLEMTLRSEIGQQIEKNELDKLPDTVAALLASADSYEKSILEIRDRYISNFGSSDRAGGEYIINKLTCKGD